jgi:hypothetical protein
LMGQQELKLSWWQRHQPAGQPYRHPADELLATAAAVGEQQQQYYCLPTILCPIRPSGFPN